MAQNYKDLKYLSQSVMLEESGLPRLNTLIILLVTLALAAFIGWATVMPLDEMVSVQGSISNEVASSGQYQLFAHIPSNKINSVSVGNPVILTIPGVTDKNPLSGKLVKIDNLPNQDSQGRVYYLAEVALSAAPSTAENLTKVLHPGMETQMDVVVGSKTLMVYFLGQIFNVKNHAFSEQ